MSRTPGINPLTPDIEEIRHSEEHEDVVIDNGEDDMFDDPEAEDIEKSEDADIERLEEHEGIEPGP